MKLYLCIILLCCYTKAICGTELHQLNDADLVDILSNKDNVIVAFTKENCPDCVVMVNAVNQIHNDLIEHLDAVVVKAHDSQLVGIYDGSKEPALIFFRRGIPILYYGNFIGGEILQFFIDNKEPIVKELSDQNFEHITQASTGSTTGDWFVFFYSSDCIICQRLYAIWESVGGVLRRRVNIARVNRLETGISTAKRFGIVKSPQFIFLRHGKFYRYNLEEYSPKSLIDFAESGYLTQVQPEPVSAPETILDQFQKDILLYINNWKISVTALFLLLALVIGYKCRTKKISKLNNKTKKAK